MIYTEKIYTEKWNGFQFRSPSYLDGHFEPYIYDLVKWVKCDEPIEVISFETRERVLKDTYCFVIAQLEWDARKECFDFKSVGTRYLEHRIDGLEEWILEFCKDMARRLEEED